MSMTSIRVSNNTTRKTMILDATTTTIRNAFEQADIEMSGLISINGCTLSASELDDMIELFVADSSKPVFISSCAKLDNAAKIRVLDNVMSITSDLTFDEFSTLCQVAGDTQITFNDENGEPKFAIGIAEIGSLTEYGILYEVTDDGKMKLTVPVEEGTKEAIARECGATLINLNTCERDAKANLTEARAAIKAVEDMIEIL